MRPRDTAADALRVQLEVYRAMSPRARVEVALSMSEEARAITAAGIRARHPEYDERHVAAALRRLLVGDDLHRRAWPEDPRVLP